MEPIKNLAELAQSLKPRGIYRYACPNCGGPVSDARLLIKAPCEECIPSSDLNAVLEELSKADRFRRLKIYYSLVRREGYLKKLLDEERRFKQFELFFQKATNGYRMWSAQKTWARRLLRGESFSIIAPTGMGKTVFSLIAALFKVGEARERGRKIYLAFPTTPLLIQATKRLLQFAENAGLKICSDVEQQSDNQCIRVISIHGRLGKKEKEAYMEMIRAGNFDILLSTSAFLHKHADIMPRGVYELIVMDDVDAVLRSGKAVKRLLNIIGLDDATIEKGLQLIRLRARIASQQGEALEKVKAEYTKLVEEVEKAKRNIKTVLVVNSATGRPRGVYPKLFKVFLNFEAGSKPEAIRNIVDTYIPLAGRRVEEVLVDLCSRLKDGILIFVPVDKGTEYAEYIAEFLRKNGFSAEAFHAKKSVKLLEEFTSGGVSILVGVATYYGVMVRGLDLPERVKYVIFVGVPRHKFSSKLEQVSPVDILRLLVVVRDAVEGHEKSEIEVLIGRLARRLKAMSPGAIAKIRELFISVLETGLKGGEPQILVDLYKAYNVLKKKLENPQVWNRLAQLGEVAIVRENGELYIMIPDVATYIQASGRCSRLYPGGITKGLSIILVDDPRLLNGLVRRMRWIFEGFNIVEFSQIDLDSVIAEITRERTEVSRILKGEVMPEKQLELVKTALLVVESPNKAKTIANFFGKPSVRVLGEGLQAYEVTVGNYVLTIIASGGHVYDLVVDDVPPEAGDCGHLYGVAMSCSESERFFIPIYTDIKRCAQGHQFTDDKNVCPKCKQPVESRKLTTIDVLKKLASEVDVVFIGTDPDSEGEKIAWDLRVLLEPYTENIQRVEFHEVTRRAILEALKNSRDFNTKLVEAQIVRRVEDRWLGFSLSEMVQKYAWLKYCTSYLYQRRGKPGKIESIEQCCRPNRNLSAGRVQTPVLGFIIEEYNKSRKVENKRYIVQISVEGRTTPLTLTLNYGEAREAGIVNESGRVANMPTDVEIEVLEEREEQLNPPPPFTTDTLLEEASRLLELPTMKAMEIAQDLFEMGLITYHRTDSTRVSDVGIDVARQYLEEKYGSKYPELFKPRTWGVGGAHEAIRPTRPIDADRLAELIREGVIVVVGRFTRDHLRLYDLIFRRFIASQMKPATIRKYRLRVRIEKLIRELEVVTEVTDKGYLEVYENVRPQIEPLGMPGSRLSGFVSNVKALKHPLPRYHDVIRWMKENGVGRPSTYAKIVQTIIERRYVGVTKKTKSLLASERGIQIYNFLHEFFRDVVGVEVTRKLEENMDRIEKGELDYQKLLNQLYYEVQERILSNEVVKEIERRLEMYISMCREQGHEFQSFSSSVT